MALVAVWALAVVLGPAVIGTAIGEGSRAAWAASTAATAKKIQALNDKALAAHKAGDSAGAKDLLLEAVVLAKSRGLDTHAAVARSYVTLGIVHIEGLKDEEKAARYFAAALRIDPAIQIGKETPAPAVAQAFEHARAQAEKDRAQAAQVDAETNAEAAALESGKDSEPGNAPLIASTPSKPGKAGAAQATARANEERNSILMGVAQSRAQEAEDRAKQAGQREVDAQKTIDRLTAELAKSDASMKEERDAKHKVSTDKDRIYNEKQALEKQLAEAAAREKAQLAEAVAREKALNQRLAEAEAREKKEREAKDKVGQDFQTFRAKVEQDAKAVQERDRLAKEADAKVKQEQAKIAAGPEMPSSLSEKVVCSAPDETPPGIDLYVHCTAKPETKADEFTLFVRPSGSARFHSFAMNRSAKGWHVAMVPAVILKGSMLQYYVEVAGSNGKVVASNGKANLPNVVMVNRWPTTPANPTATAASEEPPAPPAQGLVKARAQGRSKRATR